MSVDHAAFDERLRASLAAKLVNEAVTEAITTYGPEIYALLVSIHKGHATADDAFSLFCENVWKGLPRFEFRSSFRTWAYTIAWHASTRVRDRSASRREVQISDSQLSALALQIRTDTSSRLAAEKRNRVRELRETLPEEDQLLLVLRVERELEWRDLARVMNPEQELDEETITRESARLRKRFQAVKDRLRELVQNDTESG
ncbi:MAG TPA: sigma-70 family RNA polymerase sigma factor [Kofleriaceae bacterium]